MTGVPDDTDAYGDNEPRHRPEQSSCSTRPGSYRAATAPPLRRSWVALWGAFAVKHSTFVNHWFRILLRVLLPAVRQAANRLGRLEQVVHRERTLGLNRPTEQQEPQTADKAHKTVHK